MFVLVWRLGVVSYPLFVQVYCIVYVSGGIGVCVYHIVIDGTGVVIDVSDTDTKVFCHVSEQIGCAYTVQGTLARSVIVGTSGSVGPVGLDVFAQSAQLVCDRHAVCPDLGFYAFFPAFIAHVGGPVGGYVDVPGMDGLVVVLCQYFDRSSFETTDSKLSGFRLDFRRIFISRDFDALGISCEYVGYVLQDDFWCYIVWSQCA